MNKHIEKAKELRNEVPMVSNCSQTILRAYAEELGLSEEQAAGLAANFGGGMKCGGLCGTISCGLVVMGAKGITDPVTVNKFMKYVADKHEGYTDCKDLLRLNAEKGGNKKEHCDRMIMDAIEYIDNL